MGRGRLCRTGDACALDPPVPNGPLRRDRTGRAAPGDRPPGPHRQREAAPRRRRGGRAPVRVRAARGWCPAPQHAGRSAAGVDVVRCPPVADPARGRRRVRGDLGRCHAARLDARRGRDGPDRALERLAGGGAARTLAALVARPRLRGAGGGRRLAAARAGVDRPTDAPRAGLRLARSTWPRSAPPRRSRSDCCAAGRTRPRWRPSPEQGVFLLLLPGLVAFVAAVAAARLLGPLLRLLERATRQGGVVARLAVLSLARRPSRAAVVVAFLVVSLGLGAFAMAYRATLASNQREQAAFRVPLDVTFREDLTKLVPVLRAAPLSRYEELGRAFPVLRSTADAGQTSRLTGLTLLGVPSSAVPRLHGWRDDFSSLTRAELARRLAPVGDASMRGPALPASAADLRWPVRNRGARADLRAIVRTPRGFFVDLDLARRAGDVLVARIPREARGGRLVGLALGIPAGAEGQHGTAPGRGIAGTLDLGRPRAGGDGAAGRLLGLDRRSRGRGLGPASPLRPHRPGSSALPSTSAHRRAAGARDRHSRARGRRLGGWPAATAGRRRHPPGTGRRHRAGVSGHHRSRPPSRTRARS